MEGKEKKACERGRHWWNESLWAWKRPGTPTSLIGLSIPSLWVTFPVWSWVQAPFCMFGLRYRPQLAPPIVGPNPTGLQGQYLASFWLKEEPGISNSNISGVMDGGAYRSEARSWTSNHLLWWTAGKTWWQSSLQISLYGNQYRRQLTRLLHNCFFVYLTLLPPLEILICLFLIFKLNKINPLICNCLLQPHVNQERCHILMWLLTFGL